MPTPRFALLALAVVAACADDAPPALDGGVPDATAPLDATEDTGTPPADAGPRPDASSCAPPLGDLADGFHQITVPATGGESDTMWIRVLSPPGSGPLPVVVYGHGMGLPTTVNCDTSSPPDLSRMDDVVDEGYLVVTIEYRNRGPGVPAGTVWRYRDHHIRDAAAMLAAAQWARTRHARGSDRIVYVGSSMGTWNASLAASTDERLAGLTSCLDVRGLVIAAESANHVANIGSWADDWDSGDPALQASALLRIVLTGAMFFASEAGVEQLSATELRDTALRTRLEQFFEPRAIELAIAVAMTPADRSLTGCAPADGVAPMCGSACTQSTIIARLMDAGVPPATAFVDQTSWFEPPGWEALRYWQPPTDVDPPAGNGILDAARARSPAYGVAPMSVTHVLDLLAEGDPHYRPASRALFHEALRAAGVTQIDTPSIDDGACGHTQYFDQTKPCGYAPLVAYLAERFGS